MTETVSSHELDQDLDRVARAAEDGPVIITDQGTPNYVLLCHDAYQRLVVGSRSIRAVLDHPASEAIEFEPGPVGTPQTRPVDLE